MAKTQIKIEFIDVGSERFSDTITFSVNRKNYEFTPNDIAWFAREEAQKHLVSAAMYISTHYDAEKNEGTIYAGIHMVGKFRVAQ